MLFQSYSFATCTGCIKQGIGHLNKVGGQHLNMKVDSLLLRRAFPAEIPDENVGYRLLQKMGWSKGKGLGRNGNGTCFSIPYKR